MSEVLKPLADAVLRSQREYLRLLSEATELRQALISVQRASHSDASPGARLATIRTLCKQALK